VSHRIGEGPWWSSSTKPVYHFLKDLVKQQLESENQMSIVRKTNKHRTRLGKHTDEESMPIYILCSTQRTGSNLIEDKMHNNLKQFIDHQHFSFCYFCLHSTLLTCRRFTKVSNLLMSRIRAIYLKPQDASFCKTLFPCLTKPATAMEFCVFEYSMVRGC